MKRPLLFLLLCLPSWASWSYYYPLSYSAASCGSSTSSSFPALAYFSASAMKDAGHGGDVQYSSGADILFFSDSALTSQVPSELDYYDNVNGIGYFWVQITCNSSTAAPYYMAVGNASPPSRMTDPWDSNYGLVLHGGNGSTLSLTDSTTNGNNGTNVSASAASGKIAGGFEGLIATNTAGSDNPASMGTFELWCSPASGDLGAAAALLTNMNSAGGGSWYAPGAALAVRYGSYYIYVDNASLHGGDSSGGTVATGWHHVVGTWNASNFVLYVDGVAYTQSNVWGAAAAGTTALSATAYSDGSYNFQGPVDEIRVSSVVRGANWIKAEYNNQNAPGNIGSPGFWTFGPKTALAIARRRMIVVQ